MKNRFFVYNVADNKLLYELGKYIRVLSEDLGVIDADKEEIVRLIKELISFSAEHGFYGNLWQDLVTYFLLMDENPYTLSFERTQFIPDGGLRDLALHDVEIIRSLYNYDLSGFGKVLSLDLECLKDYTKTKRGTTFNEVIRDMMIIVRNELKNADSAEEFMKILDDAYSKFGVGDIGLHKAFRIEDDGSLCPIYKIANVHMDDLVGLEKQKAELIKNTKAFLDNKPANNCLLYGDAGTGKSTSIKALANEYFTNGLRIVEVYKHQLRLINDVVAKLKGRNYKFILYMDDLSFEEFETEYKYLKALIEGGLEKKPDNILIYATSNRRHLVRESFGDRNDDIHRNDTMQEKLSLFGRFGVSIYYGAPDKKEFNDIVLALKKKKNIDLTDEEMILRANAWEVSHGGRSGRSAQQLVDYILGE